MNTTVKSTIVALLVAATLSRIAPVQAQDETVSAVLSKPPVAMQSNVVSSIRPVAQRISPLAMRIRPVVQRTRPVLMQPRLSVYLSSRSFVQTAKHIIAL